MILSRSLTPMVGTVLFTSIKIEEPFLIPPLSMVSRSRLPVEKKDFVWGTGERTLCFAEELPSNLVFASRLNLHLSREKRTRSALAFMPLSLFTAIVLNRRPSDTYDE